MKTDVIGDGRSYDNIVGLRAAAVGMILRQSTETSVTWRRIAMERLRYDDQLPSRAQIFEFWKDRIAVVVRWIDWGEPGCWACRFHYGLKYDVKRPDASWDEILRCWNRIPLQRCHIVGRGLGGSDDVSNLFLLCRECHDCMPNTNIPDIFYDWARAQNWSRREDAKILDAMKAFRVEEATFPDLE